MPTVPSWPTDPAAPIHQVSLKDEPCDATEQFLAAYEDHVVGPVRLTPVPEERTQPHHQAAIKAAFQARVETTPGRAVGVKEEACCESPLHSARPHTPPPSKMSRVFVRAQVVDAVTRAVVRAARGEDPDPEAAAQRCTEEWLDPDLLLYRASDVCAFLGCSREWIQKMLQSIGARSWPFNQLRAARRIAETRCENLSTRAAYAHVRPVVMDALVLGHTKRHRSTH